MKIQSILHWAVAGPLIFWAESGHAQTVVGYVDRQGHFSTSLYPQHPANNGGNNQSAQQPQQPSGPSQDEIARQWRAAEEAAQRADVERNRQEEAKRAAAQAAFEADKRNAIANLKGISSGDLHLKSIGSDSPSLALKGIGNSDTFSGLKLKGLDEPGLKDAVADTSEKSLFDKKDASKDLLSAHSSGNSALARLSSILPSLSSYPGLETALEQAKAEAAKRFDTRGQDAGQFETVMLTGDSGAQYQSQNRPAHVPEQVARDPHFQKLVIEREALDHQIQLKQKELDKIKADPEYSQSSHLQTDAYNQNNAIEGLRLTRKYDEKLVTKMVHLEPVDFGDNNTPTSKNNIDNIQVPTPAH